MNDKLRGELLNGELSARLLEARVLIGRWRRHHNALSLQSSLGNMTLEAFAEQWAEVPDVTHQLEEALCPTG